MAVIENIELRRGRSGTIEVIVTGVADWTNLKAKLSIAETYEQLVPTLQILGTIDAQNNKITIPYTHEETKDLEDKRYYYEIAVYKDDKTDTRNVTEGLLDVKPVIALDPTV